LEGSYWIDVESVYCGIGTDGWFFGFGFKEKLQIFNLKKNCVKVMDITGKINGIKYKKAFEKNLTKFILENFDINSSPSSSLIFDGQNLFAISKWVSPKRTRSYSYKRWFG
jgi:hypothetical protein